MEGAALDLAQQHMYVRATATLTQGVGGGVEAARAGHDVVMCPTSHCYFDYKQAADDQEPGAWYAMLPLTVRQSGNHKQCMLTFTCFTCFRVLRVLDNTFECTTGCSPRRCTRLTPSPRR